MEAGNFEALPSSAQARGFLRMYADYLHLDAVPLLADLDGEAQSIASEPKTAPRPRSEAPPSGVNGRSYEKADEIFVEIGQSLQHQRELLRPLFRRCHPPYPPAPALSRSPGSRRPGGAALAGAGTWYVEQLRHFSGPRPRATAVTLCRRLAGEAGGTPGGHPEGSTGSCPAATTFTCPHPAVAFCGRIDRWVVNCFPDSFCCLGSNPHLRHALRVSAIAHLPLDCRCVAGFSHHHSDAYSASSDAYRSSTASSGGSRADTIDYIRFLFRNYRNSGYPCCRRYTRCEDGCAGLHYSPGSAPGCRSKWMVK